MSGNWPVGVPRDYKELHAMYGDYVAYVCQRYGRVEQSPADLLQHIWERLLNANVLAKYVASLQTGYSVPDTVTTLEACALLGVSFGAWRSAHWSYQVIFKKVLNGQTPEGGKMCGTTRSRGLPVRCSACKGGGQIDDEACAKCNGLGSTGVRTERWVRWMPEPIQPDPEPGKTVRPVGPVSAKARFNTRQVIALAEMNVFRNVCVNLPTPTATPAHFRNYLRQAVKNHFKNWVRTKKRRHKERPADLFTEFKSFDDTRESGMEERLVDPHATNRMEAMADIGKILGQAQTRDLLSKKDDLFALLDGGYTLAEAVKKLGCSASTRRAVDRVLKNLSNG